MENVISSVYPNPMVESSTVILSEEIVNSHENLFWELISIDGKLMRSEKISSENFTISRNDTPSGIYFLSVKSQDAILGNKKIIIN